MFGLTRSARPSGTMAARPTTTARAATTAASVGRLGAATVEKHPRKARDGEGLGQATQQPEARQPHRLTEDKPSDLKRPRAERDAQPDLARPTSDGIGHHAVDADGQHRQRYQPAHADERRNEPIDGERICQIRVEHEGLEQLCALPRLADGAIERSKERRSIPKWFGRWRAPGTGIPVMTGSTPSAVAPAGAYDTWQCGRRRRSRAACPSRQSSGRRSPSVRNSAAPGARRRRQREARAHCRWPRRAVPRRIAVSGRGILRCDHVGSARRCR